ncbi:MAG TPA: hypothetical protein VJV03_02855 [Pyrinomonadaceae bacterium]|nr:hypothetical protein [Pyrinomonadaceae bacterium]
MPSPGVTASNNSHVFYSRRGNGPYYCWSYEEVNQRWKVSRVISQGFDAHHLSLATWKTVPETLQSRLTDHYLE